MTVDSSFDLEFAKWKLGEITLVDYRREVEECAEWVAGERVKIVDEQSLKYLDADLQQEFVDELEQAEESISWRLRWLDDREYKQSLEVAGFPESGTWARFSYVSQDGQASARDISNWERRGPYIVGYDRQRTGERTFRQDRITDWKSG